MGKAVKTGVVIALSFSLAACAVSTNRQAVPDTQYNARSDVTDNAMSETGVTGAFVEERNGNVPDFGVSDFDGNTGNASMDHCVVYGELDEYSRSTGVSAYLSADMLQKSEKIEKDVTTSGMHTVYYDTITQTDGTKGAYLFRRCHLLKSVLGGAKDDVRNFFTGTYDLNYLGMHTYEQMVIRYLKETKNHVMYQVTPVYTGENLIADGVVMQAYSVEDNGAGICFSVYIRNIQPGIRIDYATGFSYLERTGTIEKTEETEGEE